MTRRDYRSKYIFLISVICVLSFSACRTSETGGDANDTGIFDFSSDTEKAVRLVGEANNELKRIKILYNENQNTLQELKDAQKERDVERVRTIANTLVYVINDGFVFADSARSKIELAQELNIHQDYKDYLSLKEESLEKQIEAFQYLHDAARTLRDSAGSADKEQIDAARTVFKEKEENFQAKMAEAKKISAQADELAKESMKNAQ